ncbi:TIGR04283 family arsenosugar biosynthesis glycosyltransferase [sulfur-oxidizing endosymbiont of Gigantopelta aegis]|uniref:TIGR04283 family arsenosugar biosynthesis glycosyltransferase n=1 Tax=sulfur-oxidizing endosymbiont of Gigantopelta aegis TaxID=2794934 RepID=UPI0018DBE6E7|nr:TIGR04283 family arsenosugar biosynthesis glycosyltransferase [sulfur-oxidizing endosymbiont of Gigantopelta aegis]
MWQKISFIIPVLNEAHAIVAFLQPLQVLREQGHEVVLVDGQSEDNTRELARPYVDRMMSTEKGRARQQILGAKMAAGQIFCFLHADTLLPANAVQIVLQTLSQVLQPTQIDFWGRFNVHLSGSHWFFRIIEAMMNWRSCLTGIATGDQAIFVSKSLYRKVDGIPLIDIMEDIEFSQRLRKQQAIICIKAPVITSSRRWEEKGIMKTVLLMWQMRLQYFFGVKPEQLLKKYYPGRS